MIVWGDPAVDFPNHQIRYYLAGLDKPAFPVSNARLVFVTRGPPVTGEWQHFELPVRADFERLWRAVPTRFDKLRLMFEARWDNRREGSSVDADVYFDDLYVTPEASGARAQPLR